MEKKSKSKKFFHTDFLSIISITFGLLLMGVVGLIELGSYQLSKAVKSSLSIKALVKDSCTQAAIDTTITQIKSMQEISRIDYESKEKVAQRYTKMLGEDPVNILGYNPLQAEIDIWIKPEYATPEKTAQIAKELESKTIIETVSYNQDEIGLVNDNVRKISMAFLGFSILLLIVSVIQTGNTIKLILYSSRFRIRSLRLIGATTWFIRRPYIYRSIINGFVGGLIAVCLLGGGCYYLFENNPDIKNYFPIEQLMILGAGLIILGILTTFLTTLLAVERYIRLKPSKIYLI